MRDATPDGTTMEELLHHVARCNRGAFRALYAATSGKLFALALRISGDRASAEDVLQDAFLDVWKQAAGFDPARGPALAWLRSSSETALLTPSGGRNPAVREFLDLAGLAPLAAPESAASVELMALVRCLGQLDVDVQKLILLAHLEGRSREELAVHFKRPVNTVNMAQTRAAEPSRLSGGLRRMAGLDATLMLPSGRSGRFRGPPKAWGDARRGREWKTRLAPLADLLAPVSPPNGLLGRIMERIGEEEAEGKLRVERRRMARWHLATIAVAAAAVAFLAILLPLEPEPRLISVVSGDDGAPALVVNLGPEHHLATVRPMGVRAPSDASLELWHIPQGEAPTLWASSTPAAPRQVAVRAAPGDLAAVSFEPAGGSPTGQPTGPVIYKGVFLDIR